MVAELLVPDIRSVEAALLGRVLHLVAVGEDPALADLLVLELGHRAGAVALALGPCTEMLPVGLGHHCLRLILMSWASTWAAAGRSTAPSAPHAIVLGDRATGHSGRPRMNIDKIPAGKNPPQDINVIIEITGG